MASGGFIFQARWKEELLVTAVAGTLVLEFPMGVPTVYLPTEQEWRKRAPAWAIGLYPDLRNELAEWCRQQAIGLKVDQSAAVYLP